MNRRGRLLAALVALITLSTVVVEGATASLCAPMSSSSHAAAAESPHANGHHGLHPVAEPSSEEAPERGADGTGCPLGMAGSFGSCLGVSLPATAEPGRPAPQPSERAPLLTDRTRDQLLISAHFRPPRA